MNASCSNGKVIIYELDKTVIPVLNDWTTSHTGITMGGDKRNEFEHKYGQAGRKTNYNIVLLDKSGEELQSFPWQVPNNWFINIKVAEYGDRNGPAMVYCTPFVGCLGESYIEWRNFIVKKDLLTKIGSIKIEPEN